MGRQPAHLRVHLAPMDFRFRDIYGKPVTVSQLTYQRSPEEQLELKVAAFFDLLKNGLGMSLAQLFSAILNTADAGYRRKVGEWGAGSTKGVGHLDLMLSGLARGKKQRPVIDAVVMRRARGVLEREVRKAGECERIKVVLKRVTLSEMETILDREFIISAYKEAAPQAWDLFFTMATTVALSTLLFNYSPALNLHPALFAHNLHSNNAGRRSQYTASKLSIATSYTSSLRWKASLAKDAAERPKQLARLGGGIIVADNCNMANNKEEGSNQINFTNAIFVSQRPINPTHPPRPLLPSQWEPYASKGEDMKLEEVLPTSSSNIYLTKAGLREYATRILDKCPGSEKWKVRDEIEKAIEKMRPTAGELDLVPGGQGRTTTTLGAVNADEATADGAIAGVEIIYEKRLEMTQEQIEKEMRPHVSDLGGQANLESGKNDRTDESSTFQRFKWLLALPGIWHWGYNLLHALGLLHLHPDANNPASLAHAQSKASVGAGGKIDLEHLDYHKTLRLSQVLFNATVIDQFRLEVGKNTVEELDGWEPESVAEFIEKVRQTYRKGATTVRADEALNNGDDIRAHAIYRQRDFIVLFDLLDLVHYENPERFWNLLPHMQSLFRAAGCRNYAIECIQIRRRYYHQMPPGGKEWAESCWFYNESGIRGKGRAFDHIIEEHNGGVKEGAGQLASNISFEKIQEISLLTRIIKKSNKLFSLYVGAPDSSRGHTSPQEKKRFKILCDDAVSNFTNTIQPLTTRRQIVSTKPTTSSSIVQGKGKKPKKKKAWRESPVFDTMADGLRLTGSGGGFHRARELARRNADSSILGDDS
ncbi:hypothetical protein P7C70_g3273, partial [Phenoliferia sp. Uapishka_3]